ncbi:hypothetical protein IJT93_12985 [bacterium]|nr:hypothetical protein [bacterium]
MSENNEKSSGLRTFIVYIQVGLIMLFLLYLTWAFLVGIDAQLLLMHNQALTTAYANILKSGITGEDLFMKVFALLSPHIHWFKLAFITSVAVFSLLGWILARMLKSPPNWGGILPILGIFSGFNPVNMTGVEPFAAPFSVERQIFLLFTQIICIQVASVCVYAFRSVRD